jgi:putative transposase
MGARIDRDLAINALLMAVYRRRPEQGVLVHSDQGSQFSSYDWQDFLRAHKLKPAVMTGRIFCGHTSSSQA